MKVVIVFCTVISKYLRHTEATPAKHYNFGTIEESARGRESVVKLVGSASIKEIDRESNSAIEPDNDVHNMRDKQLTTRLLQLLIQVRPVTISGRSTTSEP